MKLLSWLPAPKIEFVNGVPRHPRAKETFRKFEKMTAAEIEAIPVDPELEAVFAGFGEMGRIAERCQGAER